VSCTTVIRLSYAYNIRRVCLFLFCSERSDTGLIAPGFRQLGTSFRDCQVPTSVCIRNSKTCFASVQRLTDRIRKAMVLVVSRGRSHFIVRRSGISDRYHHVLIKIGTSYRITSYRIQTHTCYLTSKNLFIYLNN